MYKQSETRNSTILAVLVHQLLL